MITEQALANNPLAASRDSGLRAELRTWALAHLPPAMVPAHFVVLPELPRLPNGKVDRNALKGFVVDDAPDTGYVAPRTAVETTLARMWQDLLGLSKVGVETSFFELGGDSLTVVQMAARVREAYDTRVDLRRLFEDPTVAQLARMVSVDADPAVTGADNPRGVSSAEMREEAALPADVVPEAGARAAARAPFHSVLLTGGTGYTGAFLLRELLDRSRAHVHVLVRAADSRQATERVRANLLEYDLWRDTDERRISGVPGDTARPYLGLTPSVYRDLADRIELIVHNAAVSSWTLPYTRVKPVNVLGTLEVLRLACRTQIKHVHYVSSLGVYAGHPGVRVWEEVELTDADHVVGGYRQSKWVADSLVTGARRRGLPATVYRPGAITGAQDTGVCSTDTFINDLIKGCIQLGAAMEYDVALDLVPVDYCAATIAHAALSESATPAIVNLPAPRSVTWDELVDLIVACGYPLRRLAYPDWYRELVGALERGEDNELAPFLPLFGTEQPAEEVGYSGSRPAFDTSNLRAALAGSGIACRPLDRAMFDRYLAYFVAVGYLPAPPGPAATDELLATVS